MKTIKSFDTEDIELTKKLINITNNLNKVHNDKKIKYKWQV